MESEQRPARRRIVTVAGLAALVLGIAALVSWQVVARQAESGVTVGADARPFMCTQGQTIAAPAGDDSDDPGDQYTAALVMTRGLDCDLRFVVANHGALPVRLTTVQLRLLGPDSSLPVQATALDGGFFVASAMPADDPQDVRFVIPGAGMSLPAGDVVTLFARLRWKNTGCISPGGTVSVGDSPAVTVAVLGTSAVRTPDLVSWEYRGKDRSSCR